MHPLKAPIQHEFAGFADTHAAPAGHHCHVWHAEGPAAQQAAAQEAASVAAGTEARPQHWVLGRGRKDDASQEEEEEEEEDVATTSDAPAKAMQTTRAIVAMSVGLRR